MKKVRVPFDRHDLGPGIVLDLLHGEGRQLVDDVDVAGEQRGDARGAIPE